MTAATLATDLQGVLGDLHRLRVRLRVEGDRLGYAPREAVTASVLDRLRTRRAELVNSLTFAPAALPAYWREVWEERAAIVEFEGGFSRRRAEMVAMADVLYGEVRL